MKYFKYNHAVSYLDTQGSEINSLSLHDALPIWCATNTDYDAALDSVIFGLLGEDKQPEPGAPHPISGKKVMILGAGGAARDRKSTRLNSSHTVISYAVFCLKKKT